MSDDTRRDNQFEIIRQKATRKGFAPGSDVGRAIQQQLSGSGPICEAPGCTNPGGAFTAERGDRIYQFCSEGCRSKFESTPA
jgi:YHS domain-containing protein